MESLTISVDADVLRRAQVRAETRRESVGDYLNTMLKVYADGEHHSGIDRYLALAAQSQSGSGLSGRTWTRDELHDV